MIGMASIIAMKVCQESSEETKSIEVQLSFLNNIVHVPTFALAESKMMSEILRLPTDNQSLMLLLHLTPSRKEPLLITLPLKKASSF